MGIAKELDKAEFMLCGGEELGSGGWVKNFQWVGIEGQCHGSALRLASEGTCVVQHSLVAEVDAVEDTCCEVDWALDFGKSAEGCQDFHGGWVFCSSGLRSIWRFRRLGDGRLGVVRGFGHGAR